MLFFEHVLVPWDRLFMLYQSTPMVQNAARAGLNTFGYANVGRAQMRMRLFTAVAGWGSDVFRAGHSWWWVPIAGPLLGALVGGFTYDALIARHHPVESSTGRAVV